jgi:hypothetical protein
MPDMADVTPELEQAKARAEERLLALPGVTGVDIGFKEVGGERTGQLAIRVMVREKKPASDVPADEQIPQEIEGHPSDVIERRFELHSTGAYAAVDETLPRVDAGAYSPLRGGVSIGPCRSIDGFVHAGTLGAIVVDNSSRRYLALSNFHVLAVNGAAAAGDTIVQPSRVDGGDCPDQVAGQLRRHALTAAVDGAVMDLGQAARPEVVEVGTVTGTGTVTLGQAVRKRGRTTRLTFGVIDSVSLTLNVDYGHDIGVRTLTGQIGVRPDPARNAAFSGKGDSGAVLLNDAREIVGLLFAGDDTGYGVANPIAEVLSALDVAVAAAAAKRVETFTAVKPEPEFKDRFGKERKSDKTEFKEDKDQKNEAKEDKDLKNEAKDAKDEWKESKDKQEKQEKDEYKEKQEKDESKETKDEQKELNKDKQEKDERKETKLERKETKDEGKENKDAKDEGKESKDAKDEGKENKDLDDKYAQERKDLHPEFLPQGARSAVRPAGAKDAVTARKEVKEGKQEYKEFKQELKETKEYKDKAEKYETKENKDLKNEAKGEFKEKDGKLEGKDIKSEKPEGKEIRFDTKNPKQEIKDQIEKPVKELKEVKERDVTDPGDRLGIPVEERIAALETAVNRLSHFIERAQRPDLSQGALQQEPDSPPREEA